MSDTHDDLQLRLDRAEAEKLVHLREAQAARAESIYDRFLLFSTIRERDEAIKQVKMLEKRTPSHGQGSNSNLRWQLKIELPPHVTLNRLCSTA